MCPHTVPQASLRKCVLILLFVSSYCAEGIAPSYYCICVLILLYMCPHTTVYVSSYYYMCPHTTICFLILLCMCPHTTVYVSSYYYVCVLILLYMCPHTTICVLILLYMCPHTTIYVSSYYYMCPHTTGYVSSYIPLYVSSYQIALLGRRAQEVCACIEIFVFSASVNLIA
jgi:hypothetical protein